MIFSDKEIKNVPCDHPIQSSLLASHLKANAKIRELEWEKSCLILCLRKKFEAEIVHKKTKNQANRAKTKLRKLIKIFETINWDFDGGMVEITKQEYQLIKAAFKAVNKEK